MSLTDYSILAWLKPKGAPPYNFLAHPVVLLHALSFLFNIIQSAVYESHCYGYASQELIRSLIKIIAR